MTTQNVINRNFTAAQTNSRYSDDQRRHVDGVINFLVPGFTAHLHPKKLVGTDARLEAAVAMVPLLAISARNRTNEVLENADGETFDRAIIYHAQLDEVRESWRNQLKRLGENTPSEVEIITCTDEQANYMARFLNFLAPEITGCLTLSDIAEYDETVSAVIAFIPTILQAAKNSIRNALFTLSGTRLQRVDDYSRDLLEYQKHWRSEFDGLWETGKEKKQVVDLASLEPAPKAEVSMPIAAPATPAPAPKKATQATPREPKVSKANHVAFKSLTAKGLAGLKTLRDSLPDGQAADSESTLAPPVSISIDASALQ